MLHIDTLPLGWLQTNCYIVRQENSNDCIVIDPGFEPETIAAHLEKNYLKLQAILLTHGHFDHVGGVKKLAATFSCPVYLRQEETVLPSQLTDGTLYFTDSYPNNGQLSVADMDFQVLHTPGHTPGSVCLLCEDALFSGDTLFAGSCGRTDLPGGNGQQLRTSLHRLQTLCGDFRVFPGHGSSSTFEQERSNNPYLG